MGNVVLFYEIARRNAKRACAAFNRRIDRAILKLKLGLLEGRFIGVNQRLLRLRGRLHLIELLLRSHTGIEKLLIAFGLHLVQLRLGLITCEARLGLIHGRLERPSIESKEKFALLHEIALGEMDFLQSGVHLRFDGDGGVGLARTDGCEVDGDGLLGSFRHGYRHRLDGRGGLRSFNTAPHGRGNSERGQKAKH